MTVHVIGGGLAGLAAAVELARTGVPAVVYEATPRPGGRCRAFHEPALDRVIDNGNHLVLSGNRNVRRYLDLIGAGDRLAAPARPWTAGAAPGSRAGACRALGAGPAAPTRAAGRGSGAR